MRLGEFDPHELNPYWNIPLSVIQSNEHRDLALYAAMQTFVLLKNDDNYLPLKLPKVSTKKAAVCFFFKKNLINLIKAIFQIN